MGVTAETVVGLNQGHVVTALQQMGRRETGHP
jgi:hypothetical protein